MPAITRLILNAMIVTLALCPCVLRDQSCEAVFAQSGSTKCPPALEKLISKGASLDARSKFDDAIEMFTEAIAEFPEEPSAHYRRGITRFHDGQYKGAIVDLSQAIKLNNRYRDAYFIRALAFEESKELDKALTDLDTVIEIDPGFSPAFHRKEAIYDKAEKKDLAEEMRRHSAKLPNRPVVVEGQPKETDFTAYMSAVQAGMAKLWKPPEAIEAFKATVTFKIHRDKTISNLKISESSGNRRFDQSALDAVGNMKEVRPLPPGAHGDVDIKFTFDSGGGPSGGQFTPFGGFTYFPVHQDLIKKAHRAEWGQNYEQAINLYMKALKNCPADERKEVIEGLAASHCALAARCDDVPGKAIRHLHQALYYKFDHEDSQKGLKRAIERLGKDPGSFDVRQILGDEAQQSGDKMGAVVEYLEALKIKEDALVRKKLEALKERQAGSSGEVKSTK